ncbi:MAG: hypothetical protein JWN04_5924 [Myxococcaceae bacterium]|nr:hypothetical protein [Myxococcaceae bacterium]
MHVEQLMSRSLHSFTADHVASDAAQAMWDFDIGCVPVVDEQHAPIGMVTDRDICMATHMRAKSPSEIKLRDLMSRGIFTCKTTDNVSDAERTMRDWQVRRLPVVNADGVLVGVLSLSDIIMAGQHSSIVKAKQRFTGDLQTTLAAICRPRLHDEPTS